MKAFLKIFTLIAMIFVANSVTALPMVTNQWSVSDAAGNCSSGPHGLWTNTLNAGASACNDYYSFQDGSIFTEYDDGTAILTGTALNPDSILATINITFGGFSLTQSPVKTGGGPQLSDWVFYQTITAGTINILGIDYDLSMAGNYALQVGTGANDKTGDFGGSVWIIPDGGTYSGGNWDLNMDFTAVPEPSLLILLSTGILVFGLRSMRKSFN